MFINILRATAVMIDLSQNLDSLVLMLGKPKEEFINITYPNRAELLQVEYSCFQIDSSPKERRGYGTYGESVCNFLRAKFDCDIFEHSMVNHPLWRFLGNSFEWGIIIILQLT